VVEFVLQPEPGQLLNPVPRGLFWFLHLAAGLDGIEEQLDPGEPVNDNIYSQSRGSLATSGIQFLPPTLCHALDALEADPFAEKVLGEMKGIFLKHKRGEWEKAFYTIHDQQLRDFLTHL
jgi:glutamine synthetase